MSDRIWRADAIALFDAPNIIEDLLALPAAHVAVKPLEWHGTAAHSAWGHYRICYLDGATVWDTVLALSLNGVIMLDKGRWNEGDEDAVKAAAQADYESRIRSALTAKPSPDVAALVEADDIPELPEAYQPRNIAKALTAYRAALALKGNTP